MRPTRAGFKTSRAAMRRVRRLLARRDDEAYCSGNTPRRSNAASDRRTQAVPARGCETGSNPIHPGQILLEEFLIPAGISQRAFARQIGWTVAKLNELVNGKRGITADSALDLAGELGTSAEIWLNLQIQVDLKRAQQRRKRAS